MFYPLSDWALFGFCAISLARVVARKNFLYKFKAVNVSDEKKKDDFFDIKFLPVEYMSDV